MLWLRSTPRALQPKQARQSLIKKTISVEGTTSETYMTGYRETPFFMSAALIKHNLGTRDKDAKIAPMWHLWLREVSRFVEVLVARNTIVGAALIAHHMGFQSHKIARPRGVPAGSAVVSKL